MALSQIAVVGLGAMGLPMATNLVAAGFAVRGYDLRPESRGAFAAAGGAAADTPAAAAAGVDALLLTVVNAAQAEDVLFAQGALEALAPDGIVVLMATWRRDRWSTSPSASQRPAAASSTRRSRAGSSARRPAPSPSWRRRPRGPSPR